MIHSNCNYCHHLDLECTFIRCQTNNIPHSKQDEEEEASSDNQWNGENVIAQNLPLSNSLPS